VATVGAWFATFFAVVIGGASVLLAIWAILLIAAPHELIHFEIAIPALMLACLGTLIAAFLWRRWGK
jgi:Na+/phosphate symporter